MVRTGRLVTGENFIADVDEIANNYRLKDAFFYGMRPSQDDAQRMSLFLVPMVPIATANTTVMVPRASICYWVSEVDPALTQQYTRLTSGLIVPELRVQQ